MKPNSVRITDLAVDNRAQRSLRLFNDLPIELWKKIEIEFYKGALDSMFEALVD